MLFAAAAAMLTIGTTLHAMESDDKIVSSFKESYVYKTYLKDDSIKVEAKDGVVTLTGTVADESHKTMAHEAAALLPGVASVDNKLETEADAATESSDKWIGRKVKMALLLHRHVSGLNTTVDVQDGIVTLNGEASSAAQKELAAQYAGDIEGVTAVRNKMTVVEAKEPEERTAGEKIDDASVVAQVKTALMTHRSTSGIKTKVEARSPRLLATYREWTA
jgi:osmotically-inducible protein OsmY